MKEYGYKRSMSKKFVPQIIQCVKAYQALSKSSKNWLENENDDTPFVKYLLGTILAAYRDFEERVNIVSKKMSAFEMVEKAVKLKLGKFTKNDIMELCPEIGRASVENALKKFCDDGIIEKHGGGRSVFYSPKN